MRFCFLASRDWFHPEAAGGDFYLGHLARGLAKRGHKVVYLAASSEGKSDRQFLNGVEVFHLRPGLLYPVRLFRQFLKVRGSTDILVEEIFGGKKIPALARFYPGKRLVAVWYQCHNRIFEEQYPRLVARLLSQMERVIASLYRKYLVVTLSTKSREELAAIGISASNVGIVPSAALLEPPPTNEVPPFDRRQNTMIFIGKIRRYKRIDQAIEALRAMVDSQSNCRLIIAGSVAEDDLDYLGTLKDLAHRLKVEQLVEFRIYPGAIPPVEKMNLLKSCKILIQPSPVEGFSMTSVEANACGTPVVVSDGVPKDAVIHDENGFVFRFGDTGTMSKLCLELLDNHAVWNRLSANGLRMSRRYSWETSIDAFEFFLRKSGLLDSDRQTSA